jgi:hypothetical protein
MSSDDFDREKAKEEALRAGCKRPTDFHLYWNFCNHLDFPDSLDAVVFIPPIHRDYEKWCSVGS